MILAVQRINGGASAIVHFHETKTTGTPGLTIHHNGRGFDIAKRRK
jgi:hypothetical protein